MNVKIENMNEHTAVETLKWRYPHPYDFYNNDGTKENRLERLNGDYKVVRLDSREIFAFFCTGRSAQVPAGDEFAVYEDDAVDIGLGMNPAYVGGGRGYEFLSLILSYLDEEKQSKAYRLTVATFNKRAIRLYENSGFVKKASFVTGSGVEFITMLKHNR